MSCIFCCSSFSYFVLCPLIRSLLFQLCPAPHWPCLRMIALCCWRQWCRDRGQAAVSTFSIFDGPPSNVEREELRQARPDKAENAPARSTFERLPCCCRAAGPSRERFVWCSICFDCLLPIEFSRTQCFGEVDETGGGARGRMKTRRRGLSTCADDRRYVKFHWRA